MKKFQIICIFNFSKVQIYFNNQFLKEKFIVLKTMPFINHRDLHYLLKILLKYFINSNHLFFMVKQFKKNLN